MPPIDPRTELAATIASGEAVIIVGSGVSIQATAAAQCASWRGLIENGIEYCETYALLDANTAVALKALLATGESVALFAAASAVATKLDAPGGGHFREWLARSVGALPIQRPAVLEVLRDTGCQLATTNYDDLLEQITGLRPILWDDSADIQDVLQKRRNGIIHLHGHYATPRSVVLDWGSYSRVTAHEHTQLVLQVMRMMKTIVFVGCGDDGLSDPNFGPFMRDSARIFAGSRQRHYRLCATEALEATRAFHAHDRQIVVLDYGTHDDLSDYLRDLGRARPVSPTPAPARQVIADPGHCFGREAELEQLITELDSDRPARVPILGMGGIGKTTIALTALRDARLQRRFGDARYVVGCESAETRTAVVGLIGTALGLDAKQSTETRVLALLQQRPAVLLLDNFETPWENDPVAIEEWLALLSGIESLGLVITMRGGQRPGGVRFSDSIALQPLPLEAARDTFLSIAPRERFETDPSLDVLLEAMDRLPLAVTLLAHVAQDESTLAPLVERWKSERTALLRRIGGRTKNTNIETSFEMSLKSRRMTEEAKKLLSYLAALPGGVALSDASRIVPAVATAAATLRACGLAFEQDGRLRLLAPLREYMNRQYPVAEGDLAKLTSYYIQLINTYGEQLLSPTGAQALTLLTSERANIEAVLKNVATRFRETEIIDAFVYWSDYVRLTHGSTDVIEAALAQEGAHDHDAFWAPVTLRLGVAALMANDLEKAQKYYEEAASAKDETVKTHAIWGLGQLAMERADYAAARIRLTESLELARKLENKNAEANALKWLGDVAYREGKIDEARDSYETALPVYVADEALVGAANCRRQLATIAFKARRYKRAEELATRARGEFHTAGDYNGEAKSCRLLAQIAEKKKRFADAVQLHAEAARLFHLFGDPDGEILSICHAAAAEMRLGDIEGGRNRYATAIARARLLRREDGIPTILLWQAQHEADAQSRLDLLAHARTLALRLGNENTLKVLDREERRVTRKRAAASGSEDSPPTVT